MGNSQSSSGTQFASGGLPVPQSVKPCHLSGDPDLYGIGIRVGFYLQYLAAIIAIVTGVDQEFVGWRAAFVPLAGATFIGLCINSTANNLVIIDWAIMLELVLGFPAFFALPVLKGFPADYRTKDQLRMNNNYIKQIEPEREERFRQYREKLAVASGALIEAVERIMEDTPRRLGEVHQLVNRMAQVAHQWDGVIRERPAAVAAHAGGSAGDEFLPLGPAIDGVVGNAPNDTQALATLQREIEGWQLGRRPLAALQQVFPSVQGAKKAFNAIREKAEEEKATKYRIKWAGFVLKRIHDLGLVDTVSAGLSLIIYSAYCFLTPWLFFVGIDRGAKAGCDIKVLFFLVPISVYNRGFVICLRVVAVIATLLGLMYLAFGVMFLIVGLSDPFEKVVQDRQSSANQQPQNQPAQRNIHTARELVPIAQTVTHVHHHWITENLHEVNKLYHQYVDNSEKFSKEAVHIHIKFNPRKWGFWLSLLLLYTIVVVEATIKVNHLTSGTLLSSTGQLIALLVGTFMLLVIAFRCLVKLYKHLGLSHSFTASNAVKRLLDRLLSRDKTKAKPKDPENMAGTVNGAQTHGQTETREPEIVGLELSILVTNRCRHTESCEMYLSLPNISCIHVLSVPSLDLHALYKEKGLPCKKSVGPL